MKNLSVLLCLLMILLFAGCTATSIAENLYKDYFENHYVFTGESSNWTAELKVDSTLEFEEKDGTLGCDSYEDTEFTVTYKGDLTELSSVKELSINYTANGGSEGLSMSMNDDYLRKKTFKIKGSSQNGALIQNDETIIVKVTIDGKTESFEMKNQS